MDLYDKKIAFLSDSITEGVGATKQENNFVSLTAKTLGSKALNFGIGGTRIAKKTDTNNDIFPEFFINRAKKILVTFL